ncbi:MAG: MATE family efflux transporter [Bacilli bacterium]|nr:MATE family efflux transporter [Bacilli bacterium]
MKENILGTERISSLMLKFSIPCIISLLVNSLYNIVDQIFIGNGVGYLGNGATNVVFPLNMICLAFALMLGDGASSYLSLKLGEKRSDDAKKGVVSGIIISCLIAIIFTCVSFVFLPNLVNIFGCTDILRPYALDYGYIIVLGLPFMMIGTTLNSIIRADGSPGYAMASMVSGAILNIILDPIFIFVFHLGVKGAAIATIFSQILTFIINVLYIKKLKNIKISKKDIKVDSKIALKVSMLGVSSFITQMSIVVVIAFQNNLLVKYGSASKFGSEIPITVLGIVMKLNQILNSIIIGLAVGCAPIIGFNYGACKYDRVKKTLKNVFICSLIISLVAFILFQTIPDKLIMIFGNGNELYMEFACMSFRIFLMFVVFNGFQIPSGIFFQSIGKSLKSSILSLSRQIFLLIPAMLILGHLFKLNGVLFAGPVSDFIAFFIAVVLIVNEVRSMQPVGEFYGDISDSCITNRTNMVITISREYGSGGRYIGKLLASNLGVKFYDKEIITKLANKTGLSEEYIEKNEQKKSLSHYYSSNDDKIFIEESNIIKELAKEPCVIIGRCSNYVLKNKKNVFKVFIYNDEKNKIKRGLKYYNLDRKNVLKEINKINKLRRQHYKFYTGEVWDDKRNYDLFINSDLFGVEKCAKIIEDIIVKRS